GYGLWEPRGQPSSTATFFQLWAIMNAKLNSKGNYISGRCNQKCNESAFNSHADIAGAIRFVFAFSTWRLTADYATRVLATDRVFTNKRIVPPDPSLDPPPSEYYKSYGLLAVPSLH
ncbi:hypothetical protein Tco_1169166, partial [Tanacetum coccineum]